MMEAYYCCGEANVTPLSRVTYPPRQVPVITGTRLPVAGISAFYSDMARSALQETCARGSRRLQGVAPGIYYTSKYRCKLL